MLKDSDEVPNVTLQQSDSSLSLDEIDSYDAIPKLSLKTESYKAFNIPIIVNDGVNRTNWIRAAVVEAHPEIKELKERLKPLNRTVAFSKYYNPGNPQVKDRIDKATIVQLVLQHLRAKGMNKTFKSLQHETGVKCTHIDRHFVTLLFLDNGPASFDYHGSRLVTLLKRSVKDTDKIFDYAIGDKLNKDEDLEEHLFDMGLLEEG
jgi:hypothetical protein